MKRCMCVTILGLAVLFTLTPPAVAQYDFIVRVEPGGSIETTVSTLGLELVGPLDPFPSTTFLVRSADYLTRDAVVEMLSAEEGISQVESDEPAVISSSLDAGELDQSTVAVLDGLTDAQPVDYFGATVWRGYRDQPAAALVGLHDFLADHPPSGEHIVAVLDTGIDPDHPVFAESLAGGYDFTRDIPGVPSELSDLDPLTVAALNQSTVAVLDQSTVALLNQSTVAVLDGGAIEALSRPEYSAFGHGTMVAGIIRLVDPGAKIMPLKVFRSDGTGQASDVVRAINYAVLNGANVINMSFSMAVFSPAVLRAVNEATRRGVVCVASAGNTAADRLVYPAALANVIGAASTTEAGERSSFSSFGSDLAWVSAPGEGLITAYPAENYAAVWGTSFSAAMVSGGASALLDAGPVSLLGGQIPRRFAPMLVQDAISHGGSVDPELGFARLGLLDAAKALSIYLYAFGF